VESSICGILIRVVAATLTFACATERTTTTQNPPRLEPANQKTPQQGHFDFWRIVDATVASSDEAQLARLRAALEALPDEDIVIFQTEFRKNSARAYSWDVWGAAYVINGGCSDDCFADFRSWLITRGQKIFEAALAKPDSLANVPGLAQVEGFESFQYVAEEVYSKRTGRSLPQSVFDASRLPELGPDWDFDDEAIMQKRYPNLHRMFQAK